MEIKLRAKAVTAIKTIEAQKQQLMAAYKELEDKQNTILELILEENNVAGPIENAQLKEDGTLVFDLPVAKKEKKAKKEVAQA